VNANAKNAKNANVNVFTANNTNRCHVTNAHTPMLTAMQTPLAMSTPAAAAAAAADHITFRSTQMKKPPVFWSWGITRMQRSKLRPAVLPLPSPPSLRSSTCWEN
jgi:hypothetical protein